MTLHTTIFKHLCDSTGEYFGDNGMPGNSLRRFKQAVRYRQMSLLLRRPPGRETFWRCILFT